MAESPKLTDAEATMMRTLDLGDERRMLLVQSLYMRGLRPTTPIGRAALAAYDAEQRHKVRVEAMRECLAVCLEAQRSGILRAAKVSPSAAIEALIAKEESDG